MAVQREVNGHGRDQASRLGVSLVARTSADPRIPIRGRMTWSLFHSARSFVQRRVRGHRQHELFGVHRAERGGMRHALYWLSPTVGVGSSVSSPALGRKVLFVTVTTELGPSAAAPPPEGDPLFMRAFQNVRETEPWLGELTRLHELMKALEWALTLASHSDPRSLFANEVAGLSWLVRAYRGLQAAANLTVMGFYTEARAAIRAVYESAGVARMFAHDVPLAEKWLRKQEWVPDQSSRQFAAAMAGGDEDAKIPHQTYYNRGSASAHPAAVTSLPDLLDPNGLIKMKLYPASDHAQFVALANELTMEALFVAFCLRNALADPELLPPGWHQTIARHARELSGEPMQHLDDDWAERQRRYEAMHQHVRPEAEIDEFLRSHPNSVDNVMGRTDGTSAP